MSEHPTHCNCGRPVKSVWFGHAENTSAPGLYMYTGAACLTCMKYHSESENCWKQIKPLHTCPADEQLKVRHIITRDGKIYKKM